MMASQSQAVSSLWKAIKPHFPLIKFRKGGIHKIAQGLAPSVTIDEKSPSPSSSSKPETITQYLEDWQVPAHYKRSYLTEEEIEYINRGGPA